MKRLFLLICTCLVMRVVPSRAAISPQYDLASQVYLSEQIIEGELLPPVKAVQVNAQLIDRGTRIKVERVYKGSLKTGEVISCEPLYFYGRPIPGDTMNSRPLQAGSRLFLFLYDRVSKPFLYTQNAGWALVPSGIYSVDDGKIGVFRTQGLGRSQSKNLLRDGQTVTTDEFRDSIAAALDATEDASRRLNAGITKEDIPWLLSLIQMQAPRTNAEWGSFKCGMSLAGRASQSLSSVAEPETLVKAIEDGNGAFSFFFVKGLRTPRGRQALLSEIAASSPDSPGRLALAESLGACYLIDSPHPAETPGYEPADWIWAPFLVNARNLLSSAQSIDGFALSQDLKAITDCIKSKSQDDQLAVLLLKELQSLKKLNVAGSEQVNWAKALERLEPSNQISRSEEQDFQTDILLNSGGSEVQVLSIARSVSPPTEGWRKKAKFTFEFEIKANASQSKANASQSMDSFLVFQRTKDKRVWEVPLFLGTARSGRRSVELPAKLPKAHYRIFLRLRSNGQIISDGHYFETDI